MKFGSKTDKILSLCNLDGIGLEIGGSFNPILPKSEGCNIETLDVLDRAGLVKKFKDQRQRINSIEEVDYVWSGGSYVETIGKMAHYDYIIASHVLEHTVCIISFLRDCMNLLKMGGILSLVIPDKRFTLDNYRLLSGIAEAVNCFYNNNKTRHNIGAVYDHLLNTTSPEPMLLYSPSDVKNSMENYNESNEYMDIHHWVFTKTSFELLVYDLLSLGFLSNLCIAKSYDTDGVEFFVSLEKKNEAESFNFGKEERIAYLQKIETELSQTDGIDAEVKAFCNTYSVKYIYGCGYSGRKAALTLEKHGIKYHGFIVSDGMPKSETFMHHPVYFLSEINFHDDNEVGIILAMIAANIEDVLPLLKSTGARNVIAVQFSHHFMRRHL